MEEKRLNRMISINPEGRLCIDNQVVDSDMILFEEEAKNLLEKELMEGPLNNYLEEEEELFLMDDDEFEITKEDDSLPDDDDIKFEGGYFDINNEFDSFN